MDNYFVAFIGPTGTRTYRGPYPSPDMAYEYAPKGRGVYDVRLVKEIAILKPGDSQWTFPPKPVSPGDSERGDVPMP